MPALAAISGDPRTTVLYLAPTKALAADQHEVLRALDLPGLRPATYDGDTPADERSWARAHGNWLLTNPDMLHLGLLPHHSSWARLWRRLAYVVVDECHAYRGVFGSHVALVLRRLVRVARLHGADPVFVLASATSAEPAAAASRLLGRPLRSITQDGSARPAADFVLWEPTAEPDMDGSDDPDETLDPAGRSRSAGTRRPSATAEAARLMADLVAGGARTLTFVRSRQGAEQVALSVRRRLHRIAPDLARRVAAYRGGYLPEDRRELERALDSGELLGLASTNALELGIDIAGLDAVVIAGYPGTLAALWQQAGRAGRGGSLDRRALMIFVARQDPLDTYLVRHPESVFDRPMESARDRPDEPVRAGPAPDLRGRRTPPDGGRPGPVRRSGGPTRAGPTGRAAGAPPPAERLLLGQSGAPRGRGEPARIRHRAGGRRRSGQLPVAGHRGPHRAPSAVHTGAVHLHRGESYVVDELDLDAGIAFVRAERPDWTTVSRSQSTVSMIGTHRSRSSGHGGPGRRRARRARSTQVVGYLRRRTDGEVLDAVGLDLPRHTLSTRAVWYTIGLDALLAAGMSKRRRARVAARGRARRDRAVAVVRRVRPIGYRWGVDGAAPGHRGADRSRLRRVSRRRGFADRGHEVIGTGWPPCADAVAGAGASAGCPSCVQSPKCGNGNHPLDKAGRGDGAALVVEALAADVHPIGG